MTVDMIRLVVCSVWLRFHEVPIRAATGMLASTETIADADGWSIQYDGANRTVGPQRLTVALNNTWMCMSDQLTAHSV